MAVWTEVSLDDLIDEALDALYRTTERPLSRVMGATALSTTANTEMTLQSGAEAVGISDVLEFGDELVLVTAKTTGATPVFTVSRGYGGTEKGTHPSGTVGYKNPPFPRATVSRWITRAIDSVMNTELPYWESTVSQRQTGLQYIELPSDTIDVLQVRHMSDLTGRIADVGLWEFEDDMPTDYVSSGKALRVHSGVTDDDDLIVTVRRPYLINDGVYRLPAVARDVPVLFAAAYGQSRREVSRAELDKIEEWNQEQAIRAGVNLRMVRDLWGEMYRRIDEAKRVHRMPKKRVYRKIPRSW